ncbi:M48 family metallopeptidase [Candidatus Latescibacterota bacterium]
MNIFAIIILSTLILDFVMNLIADILNLKTLSRELPEEFKDTYDEKKYRMSQDYTRVKILFESTISVVSLAVLLAFWFAGGFNFIDVRVQSWNLNPILSGVLYIAILLILRQILSLPFKIVTTFVIEEHFGFNRTTPSTFIKDLFKGLTLAVLLGGPFFAGILIMFSYVGNYAWLHCWIAATLFTLFLQFILPTWILPIFNTFKPIEKGKLKDSILKYARAVNFSITDIFSIDGSKRSTKSNAFFTGFGKNKRIALFDTLVANHTVPELVAILAHEIGHYKKGHIVRGMIVSILHMGVIFFLLSIFISNEKLFKAFYMEHISLYAGFVFFSMLYTPVELFLSIFMNMLSRRNEFQADLFASETIENTKPLIDALKKLSVHNLTNLSPHSFYVLLTYSHPPVLERIKKLQKVKQCM